MQEITLPTTHTTVPAGRTPWHIKAAIEALVGFGPTFPELLRGAPFASSAGDDGADLAGWLLEHHLGSGSDHGRLRDQLTLAVSHPTVVVFDATAAACRRAAAANTPSAPTFAAAAVLFDYFSAALGGREAALRIAAEAIVLADAPGTTDEQALDDAVAALGWLATAASTDGGETAETARARSVHAAERVFDRMLRAWRVRLMEPDTRPKVQRSSAERWAATDLRPDLEASGEFGHVDQDPQPGEAGTAHGIVVLHAVGGAGTAEGLRVGKLFKPLVGAALPFLPVPDLASVRRDLLQSYPHAVAAIDVILGELVGRDHVRLPPVVLVGPPGSGKTRFAGELLHALGVPRMLYPCGGSTDASLGGNGRRWATGEPSLPVALLDKHRVASPGVILDELEKAGSSTQNGRLHDVLLGMMESCSAVEWTDPYLQAAVDLSHVVWVATANTLEGISRPLLDRCRILQVPSPGPEHMPLLAPALLRQACMARGLDPRWAAALDGVELQAVAQAWPGGSLRRLARLLDGVLAARNHAPVLQ